MYTNYESLCNVQFTMNAECSYRIVGRLGAEDVTEEATFSVRLLGPNGTLVELSPRHSGSIPVLEQGLLFPGDYRLGIALRDAAVGQEMEIEFVIGPPESSATN